MGWIKNINEQIKKKKKQDNKSRLELTKKNKDYKNIIDEINIYIKLNYMWDGEYRYLYSGFNEDDIKELININVDVIKEKFHDFSSYSNIKKEILLYHIFINDGSIDFILSVGITANIYYNFLLMFDDDFYKKNIHNISKFSMYFDADITYKMLKDYYDNKTYYDSLDKLRNIYSDLYNHREYLEWFIGKEEIIQLLKTDIMYSQILNDCYDDKHRHLYMDYYIQNNLTEQIIDKIINVDETNTFEYNFIMDVLNCKSNKCLVKVLDKTNLTIKEKQDILLLKTRKSCNV